MKQQGKYVRWALLVLTMIPLLFINLSGQQDWGDDYGAYLQQAFNIVHLHNPFATTFVFDKEEACRHAASVPLGFPLLLSPAIWIAGHGHILFLQVYMNFFLLCFFGLFFLICKKQIGFYPALAAAFLFFYHPFLLSFKSNLLSDIPFCFLVYANLYLHSIEKKNTALKCVALSLALLTRTTGLVLWLAIVLFELVNLLSAKKFKARHWLSQLLPTLVAVTVFSLVEWITYLFTGSGNLMYYSQAACTKDIQISISGNMEHYKNMFIGFFNILPQSALGYLFASAMLILSMLGFVMQCKRKLTATELFFAAYLLFFVGWFQGNQSERFMLPLLPLFGYYLFSLLGKSKVNLVFATIIVGYFGWKYMPNANAMLRPSALTGPFDQSGSQLLEYIKIKIPENETVVFNKARVMAFYTGKKVMYQKNASPIDALKHYQKMKATKLVHYTGPFDWDLTCPPLDTFVNYYQKSLQLHFKQGNFEVWKLR